MKRVSLWFISLASLGFLLTACSGESTPGERFPSLVAQHIRINEDFNGYNSIPPTSGPHWPVPAPWGIYIDPVPNERQVHNLEHGGVIIQYNTDDSELIKRIWQFARRQPGFPCHIIVAPYPDMNFTIAATAWPGKPAVTVGGSPKYLDGARDTMDTLDVNRLQLFIDAYRNRGPERIPCSA